MNDELTQGSSGKARNHLIPPPNLDEFARVLLCDDFLVPREKELLEKDRHSFKVLGLEEISSAAFYSNYFAKKFSSLSLKPVQLDTIVLQILINLTQLLKESPGLKNELAELPMIRTRNEKSNDLKKVTELYDPLENIEISSLLPDSFFPQERFVRWMISLRELGLQPKLTCGGIKIAAEGIQDDYAEIVRAANARTEASMESDVRFQFHKIDRLSDRSQKLIQYIDTHVESLCQEADPEGIKSLLSKNISESSSGGGIASGRESPSLISADRYKQIGGEWGKQLRSINFVKAFSYIPPHHENLPWNEKSSSLVFAAPSQCALLKDAWLCSATTRLALHGVSKDLTKSLFGWDKPITGRTASLQLLKMQFNYASAENELSKTKMASAYSPNIISLYRLLHNELEKGSAVDIAAWVSNFEDRPVIWMQDKFIKADCCNFSDIRNHFEPFLYSIKGELSPFAELWRKLGVKSTISYADLANILRRMFSEKKNSELSPEYLRLALLVINEFKKMVMPPPPPSSLDEASSPGRSEAKLVDEIVVSSHSVEDEALAQKNNSNSKDTKEFTVVATGSSVVNPTLTATLANGASKPSAVVVEATAVVVEKSGQVKADDSEKIAKKEKEAVVVFDKSSWGELYIPNSRSVLQSPSRLYVNDAKWIPASSSIEFVHPSISDDVAFFLGCNSYRKSMFSGEDVVCPKPSKIKECIKDDCTDNLILDLIAIADKLGASRISFSLDEKNYSNKSLMNPIMSSSQGPALLMYLEDIVIGPRDVDDLFDWSDHEVDDSTSTEGKEDKMYPMAGKGLMSSFLISDSLFVLSGQNFWIYDPTGAFSVSEASASDKPSSGGGSSIGKQPGSSSSSSSSPVPEAPRGQYCRIFGDSKDASADLLKRFPDQFDPLLSNVNNVNSFLTNKSLNGSIFRFPLRNTKSSISDVCVNSALMKQMMRFGFDKLPGNILFSRSLTSLNYSENKEMVFSVSLKSPIQTKLSRRNLMSEKVGYDL
jgi:hypothetical protein